MTTVVLRRLGSAVLIFVLVSILVFSLIQLVPGDPAVAVAGEEATPEQLAAVRDDLGLNEPLVTQYSRWLGGAVQGDFGQSLASGEDVMSGLWIRLPATISLMVLSVGFALLVGIPAGLISGLKPRSAIDRAVSTLATLGVAVPNFWLGLMMVMLFALTLGWFPAIGYVPITENPIEWFRSLALPAITLGTGGAAEIARQTRAGVIDVDRREYVRTAYANGLPERRIVRRHILRNAAIPIVTVLGIQVAHLLGGSVVIESVFGLDGIGQYGVRAVIQRDFPVVQGMVLLVTLAVLITNLVVDVSYSMLNPKVRTT